MSWASTNPSRATDVMIDCVRSGVRARTRPMLRTPGPYANAAWLSSVFDTCLAVQQGQRIHRCYGTVRFCTFLWNVGRECTFENKAGISSRCRRSPLLALTSLLQRKAAPMGVLREKAGHNSALGLIAKGLRGDTEDITQQPLPERWIDLIHHLNEQERMQSEHLLQVEEPKSDMRARAPGDFTPPLITAQVLNELLDTSCASPRTNAVLRDLRQNIQHSMRGKPQARRSDRQRSSR